MAPSAQMYGLARRVLGGAAEERSISTRLSFGAEPERVWSCLMLYEDVPGRAPLLLRLLLPEPVRTEGGKARPGALIRCTYRQGSLVKRVTRVEAPAQLEFEVAEQRLGLETCVEARGGAYRLRATSAGATEVELTTRYRAWLQPRWLWRRVETGLGHRLHRHILAGIGGALATAPAAAKRMEAARARPPAKTGVDACTTSSSGSRRSA